MRVKTIREISCISGVSKRTLQYYDQIGLLKPAAYSPAGYRLYDEAALETLQQILLYRELEFSLKEIRCILSSDDFDRNRALEQQIDLLTMKKEHLENLIMFARGLHGVGVKNLDFKAFDTKRMDEYVRRAKEAWGKTEAYRQFEEKQRSRTPDDEQRLEKALMELLGRFGAVREATPDSARVQALVQELRDFITLHFYECTLPILRGLGKMYAGGGSMTENIDAVGGAGTAAFINAAIEACCNAKEHAMHTDDDCGIG